MAKLFRFGSVMKNHPDFGFFAPPFVVTVPGLNLCVYSWGLNFEIARLPYLVIKWSAPDGRRVYISRDATPGGVVRIGRHSLCLGSCK